MIGTAAFLLNRSEQQINQQTTALAAFDQHAHDASAALVDARVGQQAYVATGQGVAFWFGRTATAVQAASDGLNALRESAGPAAATAIDQASATVTEFSAIDKRVRDYLTSGEPLMAGDVIFTEGSDSAATAVRQIETARQAQHQAVDVKTAAVRKEETMTAGAAAGIVVLIVLLLVPVRRTAAAEPADDGRISLSPSAGATAAPAPTPAPAVVVPMTPQARNAVFAAATEVATDLGRVRNLDDLTRVLGRAAEVMEASGLMIWVGSAAGADLRPFVSHGYSAAMIARMRPVPRSADNAAAAAYRSGTLQIVLSRPGDSTGAVVAPILAADGCIGAFSAEVRSGGETSDGVQALAAIFAAHLAGILATAPAVTDSDVIEPRAAAANS